jgi:hypothetical protein
MHATVPAIASVFCVPCKKQRVDKANEAKPEDEQRQQ